MVYELGKLDNLIEHARLHAEEYGDSIISFLAKHYGNQKEAHASEHEEHDKLPLHHLQTMHIQIVFADYGDWPLNLSPLAGEGQAVHAFYQEPVSRLFANHIFQPPIAWACS